MRYITICLLLLAISLASVFAVRIVKNELERYHDHYEKYNCGINLRSLYQALESYHSKFHDFPPVYSTDEYGNRLHSWRTLLIPYHPDTSWAFTKEIDFFSAWDSDTNARARTLLPVTFYTCDGQNPKGSTFALVRRDKFDGSLPDQGQQDKVSRTTSPVLVVAFESGGVEHWMKPEDPVLDQKKTPIFELMEDGTLVRRNKQDQQ